MDCAATVVRCIDCSGVIKPSRPCSVSVYVTTPEAPHTREERRVYVIYGIPDSPSWKSNPGFVKYALSDHSAQVDKEGNHWYPVDGWNGMSSEMLVLFDFIELWPVMPVRDSTFVARLPKCLECSVSKHKEEHGELIPFGDTRLPPKMAGFVETVGDIKFATLWKRAGGAGNVFSDNSSRIHVHHH